MAQPRRAQDDDLYWLLAIPAIAVIVFFALVGLLSVLQLLRGNV
ncbi:MAG TPA: hypothetical protein VFI19_14145 [Nocardioides sp.]|nr:hypothetical protein [Nocardioides sp.]